MSVRVLAPDPAAPRAQVRDLIRASRLYVSPSRTADDGDAESQHVGNVEAQASGRPVVTTAHGGIPELVRDGVTGLVVPENDASALAAALTALLTDHPRCVALGWAGSDWAARYDLQRVSGLHDDLYGELAAARGRAHRGS